MRQRLGTHIFMGWSVLNDTEHKRLTKCLKCCINFIFNVIWTLFTPLTPLINNVFFEYTLHVLTFLPE